MTEAEELLLNIHDYLDRQEQQTVEYLRTRIGEYVLTHLRPEAIAVKQGLTINEDN